MPEPPEGMDMDSDPPSIGESSNQSKSAQIRIFGLDFPRLSCKRNIEDEEHEESNVLMVNHIRETLLTFRSF
jgi:hypothetical protein